MRRIEDPMALREYLSRLSSGPLTPAQARLVLAARGVRARRKVVEAALGLPAPSLDDLPLTQEERRVVERLRKGWR